MATKTAFDNVTRSNTYNFFPEDLVLVTDPKHPLYDPRINMPLDESLVLNVMVHGVIEPVIVRKEGEQAVVVAGRQRVRAAIEANKRLTAEGKERMRVMCYSRRGTETDAFGVLISENECRRDDTPLGKANKCARFLAMGRSEEEAAIAFGVTKHCVQAWMKLLECAPPVRKAVEEGKLAASAAAQLADLSPDEQASTLASLFESGVAGGNGHTKVTARKVRVATGKTGSKMRSRREIKKRLDENPKLPKDYRAALLWVLGEEEE